MTTISTDELRRRIDSGIPTVLVEALPRRHFDLGHLPGAINIPHDEISARAGDDLPDKDAPIVVYCASRQCRNSEVAVGTLEAMGYRQVYQYVDGKQDWQESGYPLEGADR